MQLTRNGICYNLYKTPYEVEIPYQNTTPIIYKFSSENNVERFKNKLNENRNKINTSLTKRFKFDIQNDIICDLKLYQSIETRGFLIFSDGEYIECLDNIQLIGEKVMNKN